MSKFIKLIPIIFAVYMVNACSDGNRGQSGGTCSGSVRCIAPLYYFHIDQLFYDDQDVLVAGYRATENNPDNITKFAKFNTDTYKWEASDVAKKVIADEDITTAKGKTIVKNGDGVVLFEQPVPSISDIESQTDIALPDAVAYYNYFKVGNDYRWDRKTIIINVGLNKKINNLTKGFSFAKFKSFLAEYDGINSLWTIRYLKELHTDLTYFTHDTPDVGIISTPHFINANTTCLGWNEFGFDFVIADKTFECIVRYDNGQLSLQKLYGEILPAEYADVLKQLHYQKGIIRLTSIRIFFDEKQNMYVLYNNTEEAKGKYFYFEMYKPDNPTVAQHKQKIYWD